MTSGCVLPRLVVGAQGLEFRLMDCEDKRAEDTVLVGLCTQVCLTR